MEMDTVLLLVPVILIVAVAIPFFSAVGATWRYYRGPTEVTCPRTTEPATVRLGTCRAAFTAAVGSPDLKVKNCSLWPKFAGCDQKCVEGVTRL